MLKQALRKKSAALYVLSLLLCLSLAVILPSTVVWGQNGMGDLVTEQPVLVVTGQDIIGEEYSAASIANERAYTLDELQALGGLTDTRLYSSLNSSSAKRVYLAEGVDVAGLLALSGYFVDADSEITVTAADGKGTATFDSSYPLNEGRYYYPPTDEEYGGEPEPVAAMLAWQSAYKEAPAIPDTMMDNDLLLLFGQQDPGDVNNGGFTKSANQLLAGGAVLKTPLTVSGYPYTRAKVLMLPRADYSYTYSTKNGDVTDYVRGVPLAYFAQDLESDTIINFTAADGYNMSGYSVTVAQAVSGNYILAYEKGASAGSISGIYEGEGGFFTLYGDGVKPAKFIDSISFSQPTTTDPGEGPGDGDNPLPPDDSSGQPVLVITGDGIIANGTYTAANITMEKSYTLEELQAIPGLQDERLYSAINSASTKNIYRGQGADVAELLSLSGYTITGSSVIKVASGSFSRTFDAANPLNDGRYYYPGVASGDTLGSAPVSSILAWKSASATAPAVPATGDMSDGNSLQLMVGQKNVSDVNNSLFVSAVDKLQMGGELTAPLLTMGDKSYTRAQLLMLPRTEHEHSYVNSVPETVNTFIRGVALADLLPGISDTTVINFHAADGYAVMMSGMTKGELVAKNAVLAYETLAGSAWAGIYSTAKSGPAVGYFTLFADDMTPAKMIDSISGTSYEGSPYKHVSYEGAPYNLDAITGATLTVEGPGVKAATPISVRELEQTANNNIYRGVYSDSRGSGTVNFSYEGVTLQAILDSRVNTNVQRLDDNVTVVFKNRWRQEIGRLSYSDIVNAATPMILAYGTASMDETTRPPSPFVFTGATGDDPALGNGDGPLKLVYSQSEFPALAALNSKFASLAYLYVEEGQGAPGFKHSGAGETAYDNKLNTEYLVTFTGAALGREVSLTVAELEAMVAYDEGNKPLSGGLGHRDEYGLSNTTYWYVNEYEGVKLWDLLTAKLGLPAATYENDDSTLVSFSAWDNYQVSAQFSMKQLAHPELFYFYEKSPLDIGTNRPTKEQLSTEAYQPDNQVGAWVKDSNNYPVKTGYPVLLAYGVNGYPYVRDSKLPGYMSGLGNDGGPMRVIYGKTDGLNRSTPDSLENYAYFFNNGSQQLQRVQEVYVGEPIRYSTHLQNPDTAYQEMKDNQALTVEIKSGGTTASYTFTLEELESVLYGQGVDKSHRDQEGRQEKGYYFYKVSGGSTNIEDLFEGVSLEYLLTEHIGMQGALGTVELYSSANIEPAATYDLAAIGDRGYNSLRQTEDLGMTIAFAKNGYPLVSGSGSPGYVGTDGQTGITIKNSGGPLQFVRAQTAEEYASGSIDTGDGTKTSVENLTKIVVNLDADVYAHVGQVYEGYGAQNTLFNGAVAFEAGANISVGTLETKQKYMVTDNYTVGGATHTYRGLDLFRLLNDKAIGASALMNEVTIKNSAGQSTTLTVADLTGSGKKIILAYGIAGPGGPDDGKPLVPDSNSLGYEVAYLNGGGPLRLIIEGGTEAECIGNVSEITVSAASLDGWKHDSGNFAQYASYKLEISGQNLKHNKTFTVAELEAMENIFVFDVYQMGGPVYMQGVDLYKLLQNIGFAGSLESSDFTAYATDGYATNFNGTDLKNGVNGKPILVAFGQGISPTNGLPLVPETNSPGYDPNIGNAYGPLRLVVHDISGWSVKYLSKIVVGASGGNPEPQDEPDFSVFGLSGGTVNYDIKGIKNLPADLGKQITTFSYTPSSVEGLITETVKGAYLSDILEALGVSGDTATVTVNTTDGYESSQADYRDIPISVIKSQRYFVAYDVGPDADNLHAVNDPEKNNASVVATVRIYRDYNDGSNWRNRLTNIKGVTVADYDFTTYLANQSGFPNAGARSISLDNEGGLWVGTYGGGLAYLPKDANAFTVYNTTGTPALLTNFASATAADSQGGVWFSQNASYTAPNDNRGVGYMKNGAITWYRAVDSPATIPDDYVQAIEIDNSGNVWFGSFGGLTKYDVAANSWHTWTKDDGLPAASVNTIVFDGSGGVWLGCYPDGAGTSTDLFHGGYAHINATGVIDFAKTYEGTYSETAGSSLLADVWVRGMAVDAAGGVWVVRSGSFADLPNVGGRVDYVDKDKHITTYTGKELLGSALTVSAESNPEIRMVAVDKNGGLWFATSGAGLFHCAEPGSVYRTYDTAHNAWPSGAPMDNIYSLKFVGDTLYVGGSGGVAWADVALAPTEPIITVLDPPFTIKQSGTPDIAWAIGGSGNSIKNLPANAGKVEKTYQYNGEERKVRGALLSTVLAASGISGDNVLVTVNTTDGFSRDNYLNIPLSEVTAKEYFLAYDIYNADSGAWDKIADTDKNSVQASLRIYRSLDDGASGAKNNELKNISGITISLAPPTPDPDYVGDATAATAELKITGEVEKPGYFSIEGLKTYPGVTVRTKEYNWQNSFGNTGKATMTGVYLEDLLKNVMKLTSKAVSITVIGKDGYNCKFYLDTKELGVYWTDNDGNKLMLAWMEDGQDCGLRLVVGQTGPGYVNQLMWVRNIVSITINEADTPDPEPIITVLDPPFTIKGWASEPEIKWVIGGSGNSIKNLPDNAGKVEKSYAYNGQTVYVRGAALSDILAASGISGDNVLVTITTTAGVSTPADAQEIKLADITAKEYFLAYDAGDNAAALAKVEDVDSGYVQASLRVYRKVDAGAVDNKGNEIRHISGVTISLVNDPKPPDPEKDYVGDATAATAQLKITGSVEKPGYFTIGGLKTYLGITVRTKAYNWQNNYGNTGKVTMTGVYLEDLLKNVMKLTSNAVSITVTGKDGYYRYFNLDTKELGAYWTDNDGNKLMLAWLEDGKDCGLRLVVGQTKTGHINRPSWVDNVTSITVNTKPVNGGGGSPGKYEDGLKDILTTTPITDEIAPVITVTLAGTVTVENGVATAANTADEVRAALDSLNKGAAGQAMAIKVLLLNAVTEETGTKIVYTLPAEALEFLSGDKRTNVELVTAQGSIWLNPELLAYLDTGGQEPLVIEIGNVDAADELAAVDIIIRRGDAVISSFDGILLKAFIPFKPTTAMRAEGLVAYHVGDDGQKTLLKLASYDSASQGLRVGLWHLSTYAIGYNPVTFTDIQGHWGRTSIEFLASRNIVNGRSADMFDPDGKVTRAEFVKMLAEAVDGLDIMGAPNAGFSDVPGNAWYSGYVNWAAGLGIAQGNTDGTFRPGSLITREQMAAMTERFILAMKFDLRVTQKTAEFKDQGQIATFAVDSIRVMQQYGIMTGNPDGTFNPQGTATRAEAAKVIKSFIEAALI